MRRSDHDSNARLTYLHPAQAVDHRNAADRVRRSNFLSDLRHHFDSHRLVALVIQKTCSAALGVVANDAFKVDKRPVGSRQDHAL